MDDHKLQDDIIKKALEEEQAQKKLKKAHKERDATSNKTNSKGKTLQQIEQEEGGPIKESLVGMAQTKRQAKRKAANAVDDTDIVQDVEAVEEELQIEEEGGIKLEAFNLKEERQRGYFDEEGNYVEREEKDDNAVADAWLTSDEAKIVNKDVLLKIKERQKAMEQADAAAPMTAVHIARLQYQMAKILQPGETVTGGLKRLGQLVRKQPQVKRSRGQQSNTAATAAQQIDPKAKEQFDTLTEAASALMDAGETDVYSRDQAYLKTAASLHIDDDDDDDEGQGARGGVLAGGVSKAAYEDVEDDMFADDDDGDEEKKAAVVQQPQQPESAAVVIEDKTDYSSWPVKELRRFLSERDVDASNIVEKSELIETVRQTAAKEKHGAGMYSAPAGYAYDPASQMFYSAESNMYFDTKSGLFCTPDGKWYTYNETEWIEVS